MFESHSRASDSNLERGVFRFDPIFDPYFFVASRLRVRYINMVFRATDGDYNWEEGRNVGHAN